MYCIHTGGWIHAHTECWCNGFGPGGYVDIGGGGHFVDLSTSDYTKPGDAFFVNVMGGFVLDTNTGGTGLFNYRMKLGGGGHVKYEREMDLKISKIELNNIFGFGIIRTKMLRFWLGPSVGFNYHWGESESTRTYAGIMDPNNSWNYWYDPTYIGVLYDFPPGGIPPIISGFPGTYIFVLGVFRDKVKKIYFGGASFGFSTGLNINIIQQLAIGLELGFKYDITGGKQDRDVYNILYDNPYGSFNGDKLFIHGWNLYCSISLMYRLGEK